MYAAAPRLLVIADEDEAEHKQDARKISRGNEVLRGGARHAVGDHNRRDRMYARVKHRYGKKRDSRG